MDIRQLKPGDEAIVEYLTVNDSDFSLEAKGNWSQPLPRPLVGAYLADPGVLHWVAFEGSIALGFLVCYILPLCTRPSRELLLYEIGVHRSSRRRKIGSRLIGAMCTWMTQNGLSEVWVLADNPGATRFYRSCGFHFEEDQPAYLTKSIGAR